MATSELNGLERERKQLAKAGDAPALEELAARAEELPASDRRDRLVYAARQNAAYARRERERRDGDRGLAIGVTLLTVLIAAGIAAVGAFADWGTTSTSYSVYNDGGGKVQVWSCTDDTCSLRNEAGTAEPGDAVPAEFASAGDLFLVSDETGEVLGCLTLPSATTDYVGVTVDVSDAEDCPPGAPTSVG